MITFIGVLLLLIAVASMVFNKVMKSVKADNEQISKDNILAKEQNEKSGYARYDTVKLKPTYSNPLNFNPKGLFAIGIAVLMLNGLFFWANAGTAYAVQYPWGSDKMVSTQGIKMKFWGRTIPLSYEISVQDVFIPDGYELSENSDGIYNRKAHRWEFSDAIKADIAISVIVGVNIDDEEVFLNMADRNRSESKLVYGRVLPNIDAALKNTCKLMDAQDYISGESSTFDRYFKDQLEHGMYMVEEYYDEEEVPEIIGDTNTIRVISQPKTNKQKRFKIKYDNQGNIMRDKTSNTLTQYGIRIFQAQVTGIDWETSFDERLDKQKEEVAKTQLEKQEAERQYYTMQKEVAAGEAAKAKERAILEKEQIKLTIAAETRAKVAEQNVIVERSQLEVERFKAKSKKVAADAQYYENQKLVQAGLTPQERMEMQIEIANVTTKNIAGPTGLKLPDMYINGGGSSTKGGDPMQQIMQLLLAKDLMKK